MLPADSASRAGSMPEASGDWSSGTFAKDMRIFIIPAVSALLVGAIAYFLGGYVTAKRLSRDTNYVQLMWLTSIDSDIQNGRIEQAREKLMLATDGTLMHLHGIDSSHLSPLANLIYVAGGLACRRDGYNQKIAMRAKQHFLPISESMSEESKAFLNSIVEVDIPLSQGNLKKSK
jgi:hypothetical protein